MNIHNLDRYWKGGNPTKLGKQAGLAYVVLRDIPRDKYFAENIFNAYNLQSSADDAFAELLAEMDMKDYEEFWFDDYDDSFDIKGVDDDFEFDSEQIKLLCKLGFARCRLHHKNGQKKYYLLGGKQIVLSLRQDLAEPSLDVLAQKTGGK